MRNEAKEGPVADGDWGGIHARWILRIREELKCVKVFEAWLYGKQVRKVIMEQRGVVWGYTMAYVAVCSFREPGDCEQYRSNEQKEPKRPWQLHRRLSHIGGVYFSLRHATLGQ
jgi:hypothetical protein